MIPFAAPPVPLDSQQRRTDAVPHSPATAPPPSRQTTAETNTQQLSPRLQARYNLDKESSRRGKYLHMLQTCNPKRNGEDGKDQVLLSTGQQNGWASDGHKVRLQVRQVAGDETPPCLCFPLSSWSAPCTHPPIHTSSQGRDGRGKG